MTLGSSPLEFALLGLLSQQPQSGYDLRKLFATTPVRHFSDSPGSIYPALRRLQARGWVAAVRGREGARQRQVFRVTAEGKKALAAWLRAPVTRRDVIWRFQEVLLRFAFCDGNVGRDVACRLLAQVESELEAYVPELEKYASSSGLLNTVSTGGLAFSSGLNEYRAQLLWVRRARKQLLEKSS